MPSPFGAADASGPEGEPRSGADLRRLEAEARYHRDRLALYRARVLTAKPTSAMRLRELERTSSAADARVRHARGR
jgi:hypothetical protein